MGASVAYHLARRGVADVIVLEREKLLGTGSTGRNAGGVRHQFSNEANIRLSIESIARETEVTGIIVDTGRVVRVETTRGAIDTAVVVNAAGPHARGVGRMAGVDVPVDPYRRHIFIASFDAALVAASRVPSSRIMVI